MPRFVFVFIFANILASSLATASSTEMLMLKCTSNWGPSMPSDIPNSVGIFVDIEAALNSENGTAPGHAVLESLVDRIPSALLTPATVSGVSRQNTSRIFSAKFNVENIFIGRSVGYILAAQIPEEVSEEFPASLKIEGTNVEVGLSCKNMLP